MKTAKRISKKNLLWTMVMLFFVSGVPCFMVFIGSRQTELQPLILSFLPVYYKCVIVVLFVALGIQAAAYFRKRQKPVSLGQRITEIIACLWVLAGLGVYILIERGHLEFLMIFLLYFIITPVLAIGIKWLREAE